MSASSGRAPVERLFLAVVPPEPGRTELSATIRAVAAADDTDGVRWKPPERWHITVVFLGEVRTGRHTRLRSQAQRAANSILSAPLQFEGSGIFHDALWVGVADGGWLRDLHHRLAHLGGHDRDRDYRPHLTIARDRRRGPELRAARAALADYQGTRHEASALLLIRSHLGPNPEYETLGSFPIGSSDQPDVPPPECNFDEE